MIKKIIDYFYFFFASPEAYAKHIGVKRGKGSFIATKNFPSEP